MSNTHQLSDSHSTQNHIAELEALQPGFEAAWEELSQTLTKFGGKAVVSGAETLEMLELLNERAEMEQPRSVRVQAMEAGQGRRNALMCWARSLGTEKMISGYALSVDGVWRQHSWARDERGIIETTEVRVAYFGAERSFEECARMLADEINPLDAPQDFQQTDFWRNVTEVLIEGSSQGN
jgi:hypothetical protein